MSNYATDSIGASMYGIENSSDNFFACNQQDLRPTALMLETKDIGRKYGKHLDKTLSKDTIDFRVPIDNESIRLKKEVAELTAPYYKLDEIDLATLDKRVQLLEMKLARAYIEEQRQKGKQSPRTSNPFNYNSQQEQPRLCYQA